MTRQVHTLRLGLEDLVEQELRRVPFELGAGDRSVEVRLAYDRTSAVVDLGCEGPHGWRGWSGGARDGFVIRPDEATPGYLPGELEPGEWSVQLGLYRLPAEPIEVTVTITTPAESEIPPEPGAPVRTVTRGSARDLPAPAGLRWFAGDLHAHTTHSDGDQSIGQLAALAVDNGLDFLAVTDHNTISHHRLLPGIGAEHDIALLPGQEVTTRRGHANAFGAIGWIDFRDPAPRWVAETATRGGLLSVNHPLDGEWAWQHALADLPAALEFWHITWFRDLTWTAPWTLLPFWRPDTVLLGGSDYHNPSHGYLPGTPVTWVAAAERSPEALLDGIRAGRTAITHTTGPDTPVLIRVDDDLIALAADGAVLGDMEGRRRVLHGDRVIVPIAQAGTGPFRLEGADRALLAVAG
jgi:hypothetical protein